MNTTFLRALGWLAPTLLPLLIFVLYPALYSLYLAFHEVDSFSQRVVFTGWNNWSELFLSAAYWESVRSTFVFVLCTAVPSVALGLIIALLLYSRPFFQNLFRTLFLLPIAISSAMAAMLSSTKSSRAMSCFAASRSQARRAWVAPAMASPTKANT